MVIYKQIYVYLSRKTRGTGRRCEGQGRGGEREMRNKSII